VCHAARICLLVLLTLAVSPAAADEFDGAPSCPSWPRASRAVADSKGRLWGYLEAEGASCAYKQNDGKPAQLGEWERASSCGGGASPSSSSRDGQGRLWGWDQGAGGRSCAYKDSATGRPYFYDTYEPGDWLQTPACPGAAENPASVAFDELSVLDSQFKTWSWGGYSDASRLCAFKDDRQAPVPPDPSDYVRLSFVDAPACGGSEASPSEGPSPDNSRPDRDQLLWGWTRARPCAWKRVERDEATGRVEAIVPLYPQGFKGPRTAEREPPPSASSSPPSSPPPPPPQVDAPPADNEFRYRRPGDGGPAPSPAPP